MDVLYRCCKYLALYKGSYMPQYGVLSSWPFPFDHSPHVAALFQPWQVMRRNKRNECLGWKAESVEYMSLGSNFRTKRVNG